MYNLNYLHYFARQYFWAIRYFLTPKILLIDRRLVLFIYITNHKYYIYLWQETAVP